MFSAATKTGGKVILWPGPARTFLVQVTCVVRSEHRVRASSAEEAEHIAYEQPIQSEPVLIDILDSVVLQEL